MRSPVGGRGGLALLPLGRLLLSLRGCLVGRGQRSPIVGCQLSVAGSWRWLPAAAKPVHQVCCARLLLETLRPPRPGA